MFFSKNCDVQKFFKGKIFNKTFLTFPKNTFSKKEKNVISKNPCFSFLFFDFFLSGVEQNRRLYKEYSGTKWKYREHSNRFYKSIVFELCWLNYNQKILRAKNWSFLSSQFFLFMILFLVFVWFLKIEMCY